MFRGGSILLVSFFFLLEIRLATSNECCKTGDDEYELCTNYCCRKWLSISTYHECCSSYSRQVSYNSAEMSDCDGWWTAHVWAAVLIGLGSLGSVVGCIVCCVCCVKGCASSGRQTAPMVVNQQPAGPGMFVLSNNNTQQQQQQQPYGAPVHAGQPVYPPGYSGSMGYAGPSHAANPPPYMGDVAEKSGQPV